MVSQYRIDLVVPWDNTRYGSHKENINGLVTFMHII
jgi:large subunit ribosomal protein L3